MGMGRSSLARSRSGYGCSRSADGIYIALAEDLTARGTAELVTFDTGMPNQVAANAPAVTVRLLPTLSPVPPVTSPSPPPNLPSFQFTNETLTGRPLTSIGFRWTEKFRGHHT